MKIIIDIPEIKYEDYEITEDGINPSCDEIIIKIEDLRNKKIKIEQKNSDDESDIG